MAIAANMASRSPLARVLEDADYLLVPIREEDGEDRYKVIGMVDGKLWTAVHVRRGDIVGQEK